MNIRQVEHNIDTPYLGFWPSRLLLLTVAIIEINLTVAIIEILFQVLISLLFLYFFYEIIYKWDMWSCQMCHKLNRPLPTSVFVWNSFVRWKNMFLVIFWKILRDDKCKNLSRPELENQAKIFFFQKKTVRKSGREQTATRIENSLYTRTESRLYMLG